LINFVLYLKILSLANPIRWRWWYRRRWRKTSNSTKK
jgi:hypothetical protein